MMDLFMMRWPIFGSEDTYTEVRLPPSGESITHKYQLLSSDTELSEGMFVVQNLIELPGIMDKIKSHFMKPNSSREPASGQHR